MTIWTVPQLFETDEGYSYRTRFGLSENYQNAPILHYIDLKLIERTKSEARVFLQDEARGPWVLISGFDLGMSDVALGLAAVKRLLLLRR